MRATISMSDGGHGGPFWYMRRSDRRKSAMVWQRILDATLSVVVGGFVLSVLSVATGLAPVLFSTVSEQMASVTLPDVLQNEPGVERWYQPIGREIVATWQLTTQTIGRIFSSELLQFAQVGTGAPPEPTDTSSDPPRASRVLQPAVDPAGGTLRINTPVVIDDTLQVIGPSTLATTSVAGPLAADSGSFTSATVAADFSAGAVAAGSMIADTVTASVIGGGAISAETLSVAGLSELATVEATSASLGTLSVSGETELVDLLVLNDFSLQGLFIARGGIATEGATIDAGDGEIFASNIVNQVIAGENVTITGTQNEPIIGVDTSNLVGVLSINNSTGEVTLTGGTDITVSGTNIINTATLATVRARGGCVDCITDTDVRSDLTISGGVIDGTPIGSTYTQHWSLYEPYGRH